MTQKILSSMDSDDINSISDTEEALQILDILEDTYEFLLFELKPPNLLQTCQLVSSGDTNSPTKMTLPDNISEVGKIKYEVTVTGDADRSFRDLNYLTPQDFIDCLLQRSSSDDEVEENTSPSGTPLFIRNDKHPEFWTSFNDKDVVMDSYLNTESTTLLGNKTTVLCEIKPDFIREDTFIPDLPERYFPQYLAEARRACHVYLKQQDSAIDSKRILKGNNILKTNKKAITDGRVKKSRFGRK